MMVIRCAAFTWLVVANLLQPIGSREEQAFLDDVAAMQADIRRAQTILLEDLTLENLKTLDVLVVQSKALSDLTGKLLEPEANPMALVDEFQVITAKLKALPNWDKLTRRTKE